MKGNGSITNNFIMYRIVYAVLFQLSISYVYYIMYIHTVYNVLYGVYLLGRRSQKENEELQRKLLKLEKDYLIQNLGKQRQKNHPDILKKISEN